MYVTGTENGGVGFVCMFSLSLSMCRFIYVYIYGGIDL